MELENLLRELEMECWKCGFDEFGYNHTEPGHTETKRKLIQNRKKIIAGLRAEILKLADRQQGEGE